MQRGNSFELCSSFHLLMKFIFCTFEVCHKGYFLNFTSYTFFNHSLLPVIIYLLIPFCNRLCTQNGNIITVDNFQFLNLFQIFKLILHSKFSFSFFIVLLCSLYIFRFQKLPSHEVPHYIFGQRRGLFL